MYQFLLIVHIIVAVLLVGSILLQQGRGAQTGAAFGSGASTTVFGSQGSAGFLSRASWVLVAIFFAINLGISYLTHHYTKAATVRPTQEAAQVLPADEAQGQTQGETAAPSTRDIPTE